MPCPALAYPPPPWLALPCLALRSTAGTRALVSPPVKLEWMSNDIGRAFDLQRSNPFELRNVHIMHSLEELDELGNDPKVPYTKYIAVVRSVS